MTWSPRLDMITPDRIDLVYARGDQFEVTDAEIVSERLPQDGPGQFYSDHSAVFTQFEAQSTVEPPTTTSPPTSGAEKPIASGPIEPSATTPGLGDTPVPDAADDETLSTTGGEFDGTAPIFVGLGLVVVGGVVFALRRRATISAQRE